MVDTQALRIKVKNSGLKYGFIADKLGLSRNGLKNKVDGRFDFKSSEIVTLCSLLNIESFNEIEEIFLKNKSGERK